MSGAALAAANNLRIDHGTARVLDAFQEAGVPSILLKGPSVVRWLLRDTPRRYQDCDLLVPPGAIDDGQRVLSRLGFTPQLERERMPEWWREHAVTWVDGKLMVDLHTTLVGIGTDDQRLWELLSARTETMVVGGFPAVVLAPAARALNLALKAAQDGADKGDLERAIPRVPQETWDEAALLARELEATTAFGAGLRLVPDGPELAERLDLPQTQSVELALRGAAPPEALTIDRLSRASGLRERVTIVTRKLFPPPTFIRHWARLEDPGRARLLLAYLRRLRWVARRSPAAFRAWRSARRESPRGRALGSGDDRQGGDAA